MKSSRWLSSQNSLEAQGYNQGNRELWLPKPEFTAYKIPFKETVLRRTPQRRQATTRNSNWRHGKSKQKQRRRKQVSTSGNLKGKGSYVQTWIPKDSLIRGSNKECNYVRILARSLQSKVYKQWIVPENLVTAQGYYEGQAKL